MELIGLFFIGVPISLLALYIIYNNLDSNYKGDKAPPDDTN
tara:strand:+ start:243 stop:365 length:123 start_codon:yes stop_codon:yes gene_type:complete